MNNTELRRLKSYFREIESTLSGPAYPGRIDEVRRLVAGGAAMIQEPEKWYVRLSKEFFKSIRSGKWQRRP